MNRWLVKHIQYFPIFLFSVLGWGTKTPKGGCDSSQNGCGFSRTLRKSPYSKTCSFKPLSHPEKTLFSISRSKHLHVHAPCSQICTCYDKFQMKFIGSLDLLRGQSPSAFRWPAEGSEFVAALAHSHQNSYAKNHEKLQRQNPGSTTVPKPARDPRRWLLPSILPLVGTGQRSH